MGDRWGDEGGCLGRLIHREEGLEQPSEAEPCSEPEQRDQQKDEQTTQEHLCSPWGCRRFEFADERSNPDAVLSAFKGLAKAGKLE